MMDSIKVNKTDLIRTLEQNRKKHVEEYKLAVQNWRKKVRKAVAKELARLEKDKEPRLNFLHKLPKPISFEKEYDSALLLLEWEQDDKVDLTFTQVEQWVDNKWHWAGALRATTQSYNG
jgi:hypothetical protein